MFGENGRDLARHAKGVDDRPITTERETKSISQEITFSRDVRDDQVLQKTVKEMSAHWSALRSNNLAGKTTAKLLARLYNPGASNDFQSSTDRRLR
jgi:DNA polymerase-4